jgi:outer membrane protein assembly factor BamB
MLRRCLWSLSLFIALPLVVACGAEKARPVANGETFQARSHDWPQWQGKDRNAVSRETGLLKTWPKEGPPLAWQVKDLGNGYATPSIAAGRIFTMGNRDKTEYVIALAEGSGKELWATAVGPVRAGGGGYPGPRCSPTVDGDVLYTLGLNGDLLCLKVDTGEILWRKFFPKDFGGAVGGWGYSESPLVDGDRLIVTPGGGKATLAALDKKTGETVWTSKVPGGDAAAYSSIVSGDVNGLKQYVQFLSGGVVGVNAADGAFLWRYTAPSAGINCTTPVFHDAQVYAAASYGKGGGAVRLTREGDAVKATEQYFSKQMQNHHGGLVLIDGLLYGEGSGQLACQEFKTGKELWKSREAGKGSIAAADGRLYYRNEGGPIILAEVNAEKYIEHGRFQPPQKSGAPSWPHPVIANGKLYIRDQQYLFCYDVKER